MEGGRVDRERGADREELMEGRKEGARGQKEGHLTA